MPTPPGAVAPGIDPAVYFKMLLIGFFENLPSGRAFASRCANSLSLRAFLGYGLEEENTGALQLSVIRKIAVVTDRTAADLEVQNELHSLGRQREGSGNHPGNHRSGSWCNAPHGRPWKRKPPAWP